MEKFRNLTHNIFFKIFLSFVGLSFITFGVSDLVFESNNSWVAKINGKKITQINFARELDKQKSLLYSRDPNNKMLLDYVNSDDFSNTVLRKVVSEEILKNLISEMDLDLDSKVAIKQVLNQEEFKDPDGSFSKLRFESFLRVNNLNSKKYLDELNFKIASNIIFSALDIQNINVDQDLLVKKYKFENQERNISLLKITKSNLKTIPEILEQDIKDFYNNNKNKYKFDELRDISLISISRDSLLLDISISQDEIKSEYNNNIAQYTIPERRKLYNIFFPDLPDAESFLSKINKNKNIKPQFKKVASEFDIEEKEIKLDVMQSELPPKIAKDVFALKSKNISPILQSDYGYHIVYVDNIIKSKKKSFENVKKDIKNQLLKVKSGKIIKDKISKIEDESILMDSIADFKQKFPFIKVTKLPSMNIDRIDDRGEKVSNDYISKHIEDIFFLDKNQFSDLIIDNDGDYHLAFVSNIIEERQKTFDQVKNKVRDSLLQEKKDLALADFAYKISSQIKENPERLIKITKKYNINLSKNKNIKKSSQIYPEYFTSSVFSLKKGEFSNAIKVSKDTYYIAILNDIIFPKIDKIDKEKLIKLEDKYRDEIHSGIWSQLEKYLENRYKVEVRPISNDI